MIAVRKSPRANQLPQGLYGITSADFGMGHAESAKLLLGLGAKVIQYRNKKADTKAMIEEASAIREMCRSMGAVFIVDDSVEVALAVDADGVHLGQSDMPVKEARGLMGGKIIGASVGSEQEARRAIADGADYLGAGPIFHSAHTKPESRAIGMDEAKRILKIASIPAYAIGGLHPEHISALKGHGAYGFAAISPILKPGDHHAAAELYLSEWRRG